MPRDELNLQKKIVAFIFAKGGLARICTQTLYTTVGDPDIYGCYKGHMLQLEVKEEGEYPTDIQRYRLDEWARSGAYVGVIMSIEQVDKILQQIDRWSSA